MSKEMEMPCICEYCGDWFDLNDGRASNIKKNVLICQECFDKEEAARTTIGKLTKNKKFLHRGTKYQVIKKWKSTEKPLEAFELDYRTGRPIDFNFDDDEVFLLDYKTEELSHEHN